VAQPRYNLVDRAVDGNYRDMCEQSGLGVCPWSPLAGGFLTGKYDRHRSIPEGSRAARNDEFADRYFTDANFRVMDTLREVADEVGAPPVAVALAWLRGTDTVPIVGARTPAQLETTLTGADVSLTDSQQRRLTDAY